tara:strand:+ start:58 stop:1287 length:1230 start_codon:yes stop_codon:yes gene_type:complete
MFRGGKIDSRGTGITSGLADGGRVGYNQAGLVAPLYSASGPIKSGAEIKRDVVPGIFGLKFDKPFLSMKTPENRIGGVKLDFGQSPKDLGEALSEGSAYREYLEQKSKPEEFETEVTESGDVKFKLDEKGNKIPIETEDLSLKETIEKKRIEDITAKDPQGADLVDTGLSKKSDLPGTSTIDERAQSKIIKKGKGLEGVGSGEVSTLGREKEESTELTVEDYIKMLGGDKARRRDLSDMLAGASAAFLGTGSVKEGFAEFMAKQAASGPSRLEKIEQAAATLDIKDKIASRRAKENLDQTLAAKAFGIDYAIDAQKAAENVGDMSFINAAKYVAKDVYKGNKRMTSPAVIADTIRLKYQAPVTKITKELDQIDTTTLKEGFTVVVTSEGVRVFFKQGEKIERQPGLEIS